MSTPYLLVQFLLTILSVTSISYGQSYEYVLASDHACFSAIAYNSSDIIKAPRNGTLSGVQFIYNDDSAGLLCGQSANGVKASRWGCNKDDSNGNHNNRSYTFLLKIVDKTRYYGDLYYPIYDETVDVNMVIPGSQHNYTQCLGNYGCIYGSYWLNGVDANYASNLTLIEPSYNVTTNDEFWLQYSEGCCHAASYYADNSGSTCATVYFIYGMY